MSASRVKAGGVFVEIGADPRAFFAALNRINKRVGEVGRSITAAGSKIAGLGISGIVPFAAAVRSGAEYETTLLSIQASAGATQQQLQALRAASQEMSAAMGVGPQQIASSFLELLKAGMSVEQVLGGAGQAAVEFAKVGQMDVAQAGVVMADAMAVFGVDATKAANSISAAADASSTSIELLSQSFSMVSAVAALANQSIDDVSAALAILANRGVKGSDAGTSLKTMLLRLMAPADDAAVALEELGMSTRSFRDASGKVKPLVQIVGTLNKALAGLDGPARDDALRRIFGQDAIRAAAILTQTGTEGFNAMATAMSEALPVGQKFRVLMSGLAGSGAAVVAAMQRAAVAVSDAIGPALNEMGKTVVGVIDGLTKFAANNSAVVSQVAKTAAVAVVAGGALAGLGVAIQAASFAFGGLITAVKSLGLIAALVNPFTLTVAALVAAGAAAYTFRDQLTGSMAAIGNAIAGGVAVFGDVYSTATTTLQGIYAAVAEGDLAGAMDVLWLGLQAGWLRGVEALMGAVDPWVSLMQNTFSILSASVLAVWDDMLNKMAAGWDAMESNVRKGWNFLNAAFQGADQTARNDIAIDKEMRQRQAKRESAPKRDRAAEADAAIMGREEANRTRAAARRQDTANAQDTLASTVRGKREAKVQGEQFARLLDDIKKATTLDQLRNAYGEFDALSGNGRLTSVQMATLETALEDAQERISKAGMSAGSSASSNIHAGAGAAGDQASKRSGDIAGTFSSFVGGMGVGSTLAEKQVSLLQTIADNTSSLEAPATVGE